MAWETAMDFYWSVEQLQKQKAAFGSIKFKKKKKKTAKCGRVTTIRKEITGCVC